MKKEKNSLTNMIATIGLITLIIPVSTLAQAGSKRIELQRHDLDIPGKEAVQVMVNISEGEKFPKHKHPGEEIIYVLEGLLEYQVEGRAPVTLKAGQVLFVPANTIHSAKNVGKGNGAELATYIVEKGKPLVQLME